MNKIYLLALALSPALAAAEIPAGYYDSCKGLSGQALIEALSDVIFEHTSVGYNGLWEAYAITDTRPEDGSIWDMYCSKHWTYQDDQCGNYSMVGDCYNREHSMPKSWFGGLEPMYSDLFHIYPTDGYVNNWRANYPYGECNNDKAIKDSKIPEGVEAYGKLGTSTFDGYDGIVYEPIDEYKGDLARGFLYMAACYNHLIEDWESDMLAGNSYPAFTDWSVALLLKWHREDPVSQKELDRNEAVYSVQSNRNPFIDYPELAEHVWGDKVDEAWSGSASIASITTSVPTWGAVSCGQRLMIVSQNDAQVNVYGFDGMLRYQGAVESGQNYLPLGPGQYIVNINGESRKVIVR